jgi:hypothetical protein
VTIAVQRGQAQSRQFPDTGDSPQPGAKLFRAKLVPPCRKGQNYAARCSVKSCVIGWLGSCAASEIENVVSSANFIGRLAALCLPSLPKEFSQVYDTPDDLAER